MKNVMYIGYDLGDGETVVEILPPLQQTMNSGRISMIPIKMPTQNVGGKAIPTAFGIDSEGKLCFWDRILDDADLIQKVFVSFKRRPSDLIGEISHKRSLELIDVLNKKEEDALDSWPELQSDQMRRFIQCVTSFTNLIFTDPKFLEAVRSNQVNCDSVVFTVGHPTRWNSLDVAIYKAILRRSVLGSDRYEGMKAELIVAAESRAAFLYLKSQQISVGLKPGESALLIDIGSSTIDVTAMSVSSKNHEFNYGSNYLGARSIDYMLREFYLSNLKKNPADWEEYQHLLRNNPSLESALTLACRMAKERVFSGSNGTDRIYFLEYKPVKITATDIEQCARNYPIGVILKAYANLPDEQLQDFGTMSWTEAFSAFLTECRKGLAEKKIRVGRVILTGSASQMSFVKELVSRCFSDVPKVLLDMEPSRSISQGLALVGPSNEKSKAFQAELQLLIDQRLPQIIENGIPALGSSLAKVITPKVEQVVSRRLKEWRSGQIATLNDMQDLIKKDCESKTFTNQLTADPAYQKKVQEWLEHNIGGSLAADLKALCTKYGAAEIQLADLNVMSVPTGGTIPNIDPTSITDMVVNVVGVIVGIVAVVALPYILAAIILTIATFSTTLAVWLLFAIQAIPGVGQAILVGIVGWTIFELVRKGMAGAKEKAVEILQSANLPNVVRNLLSDAKMDAKIREMNLAKTVEDAFLKPESKEPIKKALSQALSIQVAKRAEDIKYIIESN